VLDTISGTHLSNPHPIPLHEAFSAKCLQHPRYPKLAAQVPRAFVPGLASTLSPPRTLMSCNLETVNMSDTCSKFSDSGSPRKAGRNAYRRPLMCRHLRMEWPTAEKILQWSRIQASQLYGKTVNDKKVMASQNSKGSLGFGTPRKGAAD
jgi:hypothetical protein